MTSTAPETLSNEIRALPVKEKLHLAAGLLGAPVPAMVRMAHSIMRLALQEIEAELKARGAQVS